MDVKNEYENEDGDTKLFLAIIYEQPGEALELIERLVGYEQLFHVNNLGQTALHLAVITGNAEITRRLVIAGSPLHLREHRRGDTPLHIACRNWRSDLVDAIIRPVRYAETKSNNYDIPYQAPPFAVRNFDGKTCLILACETPNRRDIILSLIDGGANIEDTDGKTGQNCLHLLTKRETVRTFLAVIPIISRTTVVKALTSPDWSGFTPLDIVYQEMDTLSPLYSSFNRLSVKELDCA